MSITQWIGIVLIALGVMGFIALTVEGFQKIKRRFDFADGGLVEPGLRSVGVRTVTGPPVTQEMQLLFGAFGRGAVLSAAVLQDGVHVTYAGGDAMMFVAVGTGETLFLNRDGRFEVTEAAPRARR